VITEITSLGLAIFETYHTIPNVNESNNKFYFTKDDVEITIPKGSYEVRDINEFLKRAKRKRPHHDALETVVRGDNNNDTDDDDDNGGEYPITLRANYTMRCEIRCAYRINYYLASPIALDRCWDSRRSCGREGGTNRTCRSI